MNAPERVPVFELSYLPSVQTAHGMLQVTAVGMEHLVDPPEEPAEPSGVTCVH